jgi:hypothetical protein
VQRGRRLDAERDRPEELGLRIDEAAALKPSGARV